jgi:hypothetical protein
MAKLVAGQNLINLGHYLWGFLYQIIGDKGTNNFLVQI